MCGQFVFPSVPAETGLTVPSGAFRVCSPLCVLPWKESSASPGLLDVGVSHRVTSQLCARKLREGQRAREPGGRGRADVTLGRSSAAASPLRGVKSRAWARLKAFFPLPRYPVRREAARNPYCGAQRLWSLEVSTLVRPEKFVALL